MKAPPGPTAARAIGRPTWPTVLAVALFVRAQFCVRCKDRAVPSRIIIRAHTLLGADVSRVGGHEGVRDGDHVRRARADVPPRGVRRRRLLLPALPSRDGRVPRRVRARVEFRRDGGRRRVAVDARGGVHQDDVAPQRHRAAARERRRDGHAAVRGDADVHVGPRHGHRVRSLSPIARIAPLRILQHGGCRVRLTGRRSPRHRVRDARRHQSHRERHVGAPTRRREAHGDARVRVVSRVGTIRGPILGGKLRRISRGRPPSAQATRHARRGG